MGRNDKLTRLLGQAVYLIVGLSVSLCASLTGPNEASSPWSEMDLNKSPPLSPPHYSREEEKCWEERMVYHNGKCWELLTRGPCGEGEWLVLDSTSPGLRPQCTLKPCPADQAFWLPTSRCVYLVDKTVCTKPHTTLQVDFLGYGSCKCEGGKARGMAWNGACYELYSRGLCDPGFVVGLNPHVDPDFSAICVPDLCINSTDPTRPDVIFLPYEGSCYEEGSYEPCEEEETLTVDVDSGLPTCEYDVFHWHLINPPSKCSHVDHKSDCADKLVLQNQKKKNVFLLDLKSDKSKFGNVIRSNRG